MWLYTKFGAFSIVKVSGQRNWQIRSRWISHLNNLKAVLPDLKVILLENRDYAARIIVNEDEYHRVMDFFTESVTYPDFKSHLSHTDGSIFEDELTEDAYYGVYSATLLNSPALV